MKKEIFLVCCLGITFYCMGQNVGIGTTLPLQKLHVQGSSFLNGNVGITNSTPQFPLSFGGSLGDKISLWADGTSTHYGLGIQSGLLQVYSKTLSDNIAFGYGNSNLFTQRMRIINSGETGMDLYGRIHLKNGSTPVNNAYSPGIWLYKSDNSGLLAFMGTYDNMNVGFYGGPGGWGFTYDALNSRVGIGNLAPNAPLSFAAALGKKITLYPGATGDVGFGVAGNRLQIYSDNPNADVAIGYDAAGIFNERFAVKPNGALAVNGNTGIPGKVLQSNGNSTAATWASPTNALYNSYAVVTTTTTLFSINQSMPPTLIPGLNHTFTVTGNAKVMVSFNIHVRTASCGFCGASEVSLEMQLNGNRVGYYLVDVPNGNKTLQSANQLISVGPGTHTIQLLGDVYGPDAEFYPHSFYVTNNMIVQVIPE